MSTGIQKVALRDKFDFLRQRINELIDYLDTGGTVGGGGSTGSLDEFADQVVSLIRFNDADAPTVFSDDVGFDWNRTGSPVVTEDEWRFGGASGFFPPTNGNFISFSSPSLVLNDSWTLDAHVYPQSNGANSGRIYIFGSGHQLRISSSGVLEWFDGSSVVASGGNLNFNDQFYHIRASSASGAIYLFVDGVLVGQGVDSNPLTSDTIFIGGEATKNFGGYIDSIRITSGVARTTSNFTPPQIDYPDLFAISQNKFTRFTDGVNTIEADTPEDIVTFVVSNGLTVNVNPVNDSIQISSNANPTTSNGTIALRTGNGSLAANNLELDGYISTEVSESRSNEIVSVPASVTAIDTIPLADFRSAEYLIHAWHPTAGLQVSKILVGHDGTSSYITEYGIVNSIVKYVEITAAIQGANLVLFAEPTAASTNIKYFKTQLN